MLHYSLLYSALLYSATFDRCWQFVQCCTIPYFTQLYSTLLHLIDVDNVYNAARRTLIWKRKSEGGHTAWSAAWEACLWARLGQFKFKEYFQLSAFHFSLISLSRSHSLSFILSTSLSVLLSLFLYLNSSLFTLCLTPCLYLYICLCFFVFLPSSFCLPFFHPLSISLFLSSTLLFFNLFVSLSSSLCFFLLLLYYNYLFILLRWWGRSLACSEENHNWLCYTSSPYITSSHKYVRCRAIL